MSAAATVSADPAYAAIPACAGDLPFQPAQLTPAATNDEVMRLFAGKAMQNFVIPATRQTPAVELSVSQHRLRIAGEAYPENAVSFFEPVLKVVADDLALERTEPFEVEFELRYLNSAATKMVFKLAGLLDEAAGRGRPVRVRFVTLEDDEILQELGLDMKTDCAWLEFEFVQAAL